VVGQMPGHGAFHPVAWCQYYDGGKVWATTLGHDAGIFANDDAKFPGSVAYRKLIVGGMKSVMGIEPFCR
jgi:type 1 glutamine amidotransferase